MNESSTGENKSLGTQPSGSPKSAARWRRNAIVGLIGAPVFLAGLTLGGFGLFTWSGGGDPAPREIQSHDNGSGGAYFRVHLDYAPRQDGGPGAGWARRFGASLFDEGLTTTVAVDIARGQGRVERIARWRGDSQASANNQFTAYRKQDQATIAVTLTRAAQPRLRWYSDPPQWIADLLRGLMPRSGVDQPAPIRISPPAVGRQSTGTTITVYDYKGIAIGDLQVTAQWRPSVLFDPALVHAGPVPNPAIESFVKDHAGATARIFAVVETIRTNNAGVTESAEIKPWILKRYAALPGNRAQCAETCDAAVGRFGLSAGDAALLTYFLHRDGPSFTGAASLAKVCGRKSLGAALIRIGAPPPGKTEPPAPKTASPAPKAAPPDSIQATVKRARKLLKALAKAKNDPAAPRPQPARKATAPADKKAPVKQARIRLQAPAAAQNVPAAQRLQPARRATAPAPKAAPPARKTAAPAGKQAPAKQARIRLREPVAAQNVPPAQHLQPARRTTPPDPKAAAPAKQARPREPAGILRRLAREWEGGLAPNRRAESMRILRADAALVEPNQFSLVRTAPLADRAAILDDNAANRVLHFKCFTKHAENSIAAIVERQQGAAPAVFHYRFFFDAQNKIYKIHRRPAIQADIRDLKRARRGVDCTDRFLAREETLLRPIIGGNGAAEAPRAVAPATRIIMAPPKQVIIESNQSWTGPPPGGRARNRVTVDLTVLDAIP